MAPIDRIWPVMSTTENAIRTGEILPPIINPPLPLTDRLNCAVRLWAFKGLVVAALAVIRTVWRSDFDKHKPTYTKRYAAQPTLENRIFIPTDWKSGERLPLYIDIHGGGFALCDPQTDDEFCRHFADTYNICVVSLDYRKAPTYPFPVGLNDTVDMARAVLEDADLPFDPSKVALGGFSAGGNLALAATQVDDLRAKIKGVVTIYPVVDFVTPSAEKLETVPSGKPDILANTAQLFNWGYINEGDNRRDPHLSPLFAPRDQLPRKVCFFGAEFDMLCDEAHKLALRLERDEPGERTGTEDDWTHGGIKWEKVLGFQHGFTHVRAKGDEETARRRASEHMYRKAAEWLKREVF